VQAPATLRPLQVEAARAAGWADAAPPADGWTPVTLPDTWTTRWPGFDGVVWYRLTWDQPADAPDAGLMLAYFNMAGEVRLNGTPIARDANLVEPLTRSWNTPRYWLLAPPLLRSGGSNTLLVRVSGLAAYQPGLGPVEVGPSRAVAADYASERLMRRDLQILGISASAVVASIFAALWLLRRRETAYGWFALMSLLWLVFVVNQIVTSPWPFATTDGWQAWSTSLLMAFCGSFAVFTLRFCDRRLPRLEIGLLLLTLICWIDLWQAAPSAMAAHRGIWTVVACTLSFGTSLGFLAFLGVARNRSLLALAPFMALTAAASTHDLLVFLQVLDSNLYYSAITSYALVLGMALILAARFVQGLNRIENFNTELVDEVSAARAELAGTLAQRHALELAHARIGERVNLASDLHDGLGGMLVGSIATLEHAPDTLSAPVLLAMLKRLRDDLRLIIDATGRDDGAPQPFGELLAPLRHRVTQLLDANGIDCRWQVSGIDALQLPPSQSLDLLRFLQEALTNVLKHSRGTRADVSVVCANGALRLAVQDDGRGFAVAQAEQPGQARGAGLRSMRARARRLGAQLSLDPVPGATQVGLHLPLAASRTSAF
jgi:signal transduction histidine kinase